MKKPLTEQELETMLKQQGTVQPATAFRYQKKTAPLLWRRTVLPFAALLSALLLTALLIPFAASRDTASPSTTANLLVPPSSGSADTDHYHPDKRPPITTLPPVTGDPKPPETLLPLSSYLPDSYGVENLRLSLMIADQRTDGIRRLNSVSGEDFTSYTSYIPQKALPQGQTLISGRYTKVKTNDELHKNCTDVFYDLEGGELFCISHPLNALLESLADESLPSAEEMSIYHFDIATDRYIFTVNETSLYAGFYLVCLEEGTVTKLPIRLHLVEQKCISPDFSYLIIRKPSGGGDEMCQVQYLSTGEIITPYGKTAITDDPIYSDDGRIFIRRLTYKDDGMDYIALDTQTGTVTRCDGEFCYFAGNVLLTRSESGFHAYDCTTGEELSDLSMYPLFAEVTRPYQWNTPSLFYFLQLYEPSGNTPIAVIGKVNAYTVSRDGQWLYTYCHGDNYLTCYNLADQTSFRLPVSEEFIVAAASESDLVCYQITVNEDRSFLSISYTAENRSLVYEYTDIHQEYERVYAHMLELYQRSDNLQDFWTAFYNTPESLSEIILYTAADDHGDYLIWEISLRSQVNIDFTRILRIVEDYRDGSMTMYWGDTNPNSIYQFKGTLNITSKRFPNGKHYIRKSMANADYASTRALLETVEKQIGCFFDYGKCYDETGEWSDALAIAYVNSYGYLGAHTASANFGEDPAKLERVLQIITRNPRLYEYDELFDAGTTVKNRKVADIRLYAADGSILYVAGILVTADGEYYLCHPLFVSSSPMAKISREDYYALMEIRGGFLYTSGLYKDLRIASIPGGNISPDTADFLYSGKIKAESISSTGCADAMDRYQDETVSDLALLQSIFKEDVHLFIQLLIEHSVHYSWSGTYSNYAVSFTLTDGALTAFTVKPLTYNK